MQSNFIPIIIINYENKKYSVIPYNDENINFVISKILTKLNIYTDKNNYQIAKLGTPILYNKNHLPNQLQIFKLNYEMIAEINLLQQQQYRVISPNLTIYTKTLPKILIFEKYKTVDYNIIHSVLKLIVHNNDVIINFTDLYHIYKMIPNESHFKDNAFLVYNKVKPKNNNKITAAQNTRKYFSQLKKLNKQLAIQNSLHEKINDLNIYMDSIKYTIIKDKIKWCKNEIDNAQRGYKNIKTVLDNKSKNKNKENQNANKIGRRKYRRLRNEQLRKNNNNNFFHFKENKDIHTGWSIDSESSQSVKSINNGNNNGSNNESGEQ
jgi:hypothetical protein